MRKFAIAALSATLLPLSAEADPSMTLQGDVTEGAVLRGATAPGNRITFDGTELPVSAQGDFVFGLHRDHEEPVTLTVTDVNGASQTYRYEVIQREYKIQRIDGLPQKMVSPRAPEIIERIKREGAIKSAARPDATPETWYTEEFIWPAKGPISGVYGSQRILNGEPKTPHYGVDVASPTGTPVVAPASGKITLAEKDMYFEGGLVFLDHGHGLISVMMHLDSVKVKPGQMVQQGDLIGTIGATGRATGPHLDWRMYWRKARVDPTTLVGPMGE